MKILSLLLLAFILSGCATLPPEYAKSPDRYLVIGKTSNDVQTLIRSVDDGKVLFVKGYQLGNKVWLTEGPHKLSVTCVKLESWGTIIKHKDIAIFVKKGHTYELQGHYQEGNPSVLVKEISNP
jgi:hypothetical protein